MVVGRSLSRATLEVASKSKVCGKKDDDLFFQSPAMKNYVCMGLIDHRTSILPAIDLGNLSANGWHSKHCETTQSALVEYECPPGYFFGKQCCEGLSVKEKKDLFFTRLGSHDPARYK